MSKNDFSKQLTKLQREINRRLADRADNIAYGLREATVDLFVHNARQRVLDRATPKDANSIVLVNTVANNIVSEDDYIIKVLPDNEGLYMFLEYGTGVLGWFYGHPEASKIGWEYMTDPSHYVLKNIPRAGISTGLQGWFFHYNGDNYLDYRDEYPNIVRVKYTQTTQMGGGFTDKNGRHVRRYRRRRNTNRAGEFSTFEKDYTQYNWAFSSGLEPLRYFYDTKIEIQNIFRELKHRIASGEDDLMKDSKAIKEFMNSKKL